MVLVTEPFDCPFPAAGKFGEVGLGDLPEVVGGVVRVINTPFIVEPPGLCVLCGRPVPSAGRRA